jgi:hypothetical protein
MQSAQELEREDRSLALIDRAIAASGSKDSINSAVRNLENGK